MTSRRKQIKPIKTNTEFVNELTKEEIQFMQLTEWRNETPADKEQITEARDEVNIEDCSSSEEENLNPLNFDVKPDSTMKIKMPKDDAKIIPMETLDGVDVFQCPLCNKGSISGRESLTVHLQEHQNKTRREDGKHVCCLCSKELSSNSSLERHLLTHSNHRPFSCTLCDKKFTTNGNLSRHIKTSHSNTATSGISSNNNNATNKPNNATTAAIVTSFPSQVAMPIHNSSAQLNSSIDSSIDEVIKKHNIHPNPNHHHHHHHHHLSNSKPSATDIFNPAIQPQTCASNNYLTIETSSPSHPLSSGGGLTHSSSSSILTLSSIASSPMTHHSVLTPNSTNPVPSSNISFLSPFLSMNISDLTSIFKAQLHPNNSTSTTSTTSTKNNSYLSNLDILRCNNNKDFSLSTLFKQFPALSNNNNQSLESPRIKRSKNFNSNLLSISPIEIKKRNQFHRKLTYHLKRKNSHKFNIKSRNQCLLRCQHCRQDYLRTDIFLRHIKKCLPKSTQPLFCPLASCNKRSSSVRKLLQHIKSRHNIVAIPRRISDRDNDEPLNLSVKSDNVQDPKLTPAHTHSINTFLPFLPTFNNASTTKLDVNSVNSAGIFPNLLHTPQISSLFLGSSNPLNPQMIPSFPLSCHSNTSSPSILKPISNCNSVPLCFSSSSSSETPVPVPSSFSVSVPISASSSLLPMTTNHVSNPQTHNTKKKNSYKDAPKLITCPMDGCAQKFPWNSSLMRHILTHTSHKPFKCTRCTKSFSTKSNRERHMTRVHRVRINRLKFKHTTQNQFTQHTIDHPAQIIDVNTPLNDVSCNLKWHARQFTTNDNNNNDNNDNNNNNNNNNNSSLQKEKVTSSSITVTALGNHQDNETEKVGGTVELSEEEWMLMDSSDRQAENISSNLLKLAGQPIVEPNPIRLSNGIQVSSSPTNSIPPNSTLFPSSHIL